MVSESDGALSARSCAGGIAPVWAVSLLVQTRASSVVVFTTHLPVPMSHEPAPTSAVVPSLDVYSTAVGARIGAGGEDDLELLPLVISHAGDLDLGYCVVPGHRLIDLVVRLKEALYKTGSVEFRHEGFGLANPRVFSLKSGRPGRCGPDHISGDVIANAESSLATQLAARGNAPSWAVSFTVNTTEASSVVLFTRHTRTPRLPASREGSAAVGCDPQPARRSGAPQVTTMSTNALRDIRRVFSTLSP